MLCEVRDIMFSWMRPVAVLTSQFFLSDEEGDFKKPLRINGGRESLQQKVDFKYDYNCPQKSEQVQRDGPTENRCDGICILDIICWFSKWLNTQKFESGNGLCELNGHYK